MKCYLSNYTFNELEPLESWETLKRNIKIFCIDFSRKTNKSTKKDIAYLQSEIQKIEELQADNIDMNRKRNLENELTKLIDKKTKGAQIRSRAN